MIASNAPSLQAARDAYARFCAWCFGYTEATVENGEPPASDDAPVEWMRQPASDGDRELRAATLARFLAAYRMRSRLPAYERAIALELERLGVPDFAWLDEEQISALLASDINAVWNELERLGTCERHVVALASYRADHLCATCERVLARDFVHRRAMRLKLEGPQRHDREPADVVSIYRNRRTSP